MEYKPNTLSLDCYGTLINFEMGPTTKSIIEERAQAERMPAFPGIFEVYRLDEVPGEWKPFFDVFECTFDQLGCGPDQLITCHRALATTS